MPKFKDFYEMEAYIKKNIWQTVARNKKMESVMAEVMQQAVYDVVYAHYEPKEYVRRREDDGLSDVRNMGITDFGVDDGGNVFIIFENLTEGNDSMRRRFTTDTIVEGLKDNWTNPDGPWSDRRDFIGETAKRLRDNPTPLLNAFKEGLIKKGFVVK